MSKILKKMKYNFDEADLETMFKVYLDRRENAVFNLNETLYLTLPETVLQKTIIDHPLHWSIISHRLYSTPRLAWLLMKLNNIGPENLFKRVDPGTTVYYLPRSSINSVLREIENTKQ